MRAGGLTCGLVLLATVARAAPINLVTNGSFETGTGNAGMVGNFAGWTVGGSSMGSGPGNGPQRVQYGPGTTAYGDAVSADPFLLSPDPSGRNAAYFVDDSARETLSQSIAIVGSTIYEVGFDFFETWTGAANPSPFTLNASLNGSTLATIGSGDPAYGPGQWYHIYDVFTPTFSGNSGFTFSYMSGPAFAKDVIVDDVYVETAPAADVPEPASLALLAVGLGALAYLAMRVRRQT